MRHDLVTLFAGKAGTSGSTDAAGGTARFSSPLSVDDFQTRSSLLSLTPAALARWKEPIARLAALEGLEAHARSITIRMEEV
jgi:histidinol dehydrogenase